MTNETRTVRFELHILPMFRLVDRDHMAAWFDLHDPSTFYEPGGQPRTAFIHELGEHLIGERLPLMPPSEAGGPWPQEWIDLYKRWMQQGCPRLELGIGQYEAMRLSDNEVLLSAQVEVPSQNDEAWFEHRYEDSGTRMYILFIEPQSKSPKGQGGIKFIEEQISDVPLSISTLAVLDRAGRHSVLIDGENQSLDV